MIKILVALVLALAATGAHADPVSAVIAIATIAGTGGAVMAGTATLLTGLAFAGASISLIGNVTGNEKLSKIGAVVGAGAGLASLAQGALTAATAADTAMDAASAGADAAGASYEAGAAAAAPGADAAAGGAAGVGSVDATADLALQDAAEGARSAASSYAENAAGAAPSGATAAGAERAGKPEIGTGDKLSSAAKWIKDNKELVDIGSGLVKGAMGGMTDADAKLMSQREMLDYEREKKANFNNSVINGSAVNFRVNPNVAVTQVSPQDPTRYVPIRGLVARAQGAK